MLILGLLGMYIDAAVVFFTMTSLFFRMAMASCETDYVISSSDLKMTKTQPTREINR